MTEAQTKVPCPLCGTQIAPGLYRCPQCTGELQLSGASSPAAPRTLTASGVFVAVVLAMVVVIGGIWVYNELTTTSDLECASQEVDRAFDDDAYVAPDCEGR